MHSSAVLELVANYYYYYYLFFVSQRERWKNNFKEERERALQRVSTDFIETAQDKEIFSTFSSCSITNAVEQKSSSSSNSSAGYYYNPL